MGHKDSHNALLCLKCRGSGHLVKDCRASEWHEPEELQTLTSERRTPVKRFKILDEPIYEVAELCSRCTALNVSEMLLQPLGWKSYVDIGNLVDEGRAPFTPLGQVGELQYLASCPLCRCLFAITPGPYSEDQDVVVFPAWTVFRLEGSIHMDTAAKQSYSRCLIVTLRPTHPTFRKVEFADCITRGDALGILEDERYPLRTTLNARRLGSEGIDIGLIQRWISSCQRRHPWTCVPQYADSLRNIKLLDCASPFEHKLVEYPTELCEHLALSYVWGGIAKRSFELGPIPIGTLPRTIEDAIVLTRRLGFRYLWCDLVCIDQFNEEDKRAQISMMADIYRGAHATIIAMSGESADTGLPQVRQQSTGASQVSCKINGMTLVSLMPTLTHLIWSSPWAQRSWTFQEALLSRRCIYVTDWQMHFECNGMTCCETLDESRSPIHQMLRRQDPESNQSRDIGTGCLRFTAPSFTLHAYASAINLYSYRSMSDPGDAINAFAGMIQDWTDRNDNLYFHFGLPNEYFQWGLLFVGRTALVRRLGFPSWSWAGWIGPLKPRLPIKLHDTEALPTYISVYRQSPWELLFRSRTNAPAFSLPVDDPVREAGEESKGYDWPQHDSKDETIILVEGIMLRMTPRRDPVNMIEWNAPRFLGDGLTFHSLKLHRGSCIMAWDDFDVAMQARLGFESDFLLVTRELSDGWVHHWLLLLDIQNDIATRVTTVRLSVMVSHLHILSVLWPTKRRLLLA